MITEIANTKQIEKVTNEQLNNQYKNILNR